MNRRHWIPALIALVAGCDATGPRVVATAEFASSDTTALIGDTLRLSLLVRDADGNVVHGAPIRWSSADSMVAAGIADGRILARREGSTSIIAAVDTIAVVTTIAVVPPGVGRCAARGRYYSGRIAGGHWTVATGPHHLRDTVTVSDPLTIEPGAVVCGLPGAVLWVKAMSPGSSGPRLQANGTPADSIIFTADHPTRPWAGLKADASQLHLSYVRLELATRGIELEAAGLVIEHSRLRRASIIYPGRHSFSTVRSTVVDSGSVGIYSGTFEDNTVRHGGVFICSGAVNGGRIENAPGISFSAGHPDPLVFCSASLSSSRPLRILGSRGNPVHAPLSAFQTIWPAEARDSLLGNPNDTLRLWGSTRPENLSLGRAFVWRFPCGQMSIPVAPGACRVQNLTIEPGTSLLVSGDLVATGVVTASGTAMDSIRILPGSRDSMPRFVFDSTSRSAISYAAVSRVELRANSQHELHLRNSKTQGAVILNAPLSTVTDTELSDFLPWASFIPPVALLLGGSGTRAERVSVRRTAVGNSSASPNSAVVINASDVQLLSCIVTHNGGDGIRVQSGSNVRINDCNIEGNGGNGVINAGTSRVDARRNWWGDPAGPLGPNGDGVSGDVDYSEFRTSPPPQPTSQRPAKSKDLDTIDAVLINRARRSITR